MKDLILVSETDVNKVITSCNKIDETLVANNPITPTLIWKKHPTFSLLRRMFQISAVRCTFCKI